MWKQGFRGCGFQARHTFRDIYVYGTRDSFQRADRISRRAEISRLPCGCDAHRILLVLPPARPGQVILEVDQLVSDKVPVRNWVRMHTVWITPGMTAEFDAYLPKNGGDSDETILHIVAMAAPDYTPGNETGSRQIPSDFIL